MIPVIPMNQAIQHIKDCFSAGTSPFLIGDTGAGKTDVYRQVADQLNLELIIVYLDSMYEMDVIGYAVPNQKTGKFNYLPCELFPLETDAIPAGKKGFLILLDEFGNCPPSMQVAAQRVILEGAIGSHKLHPKAFIGLAGNKISSGANAVPISAAIRSRCGIAEIDCTTQDYVDQALKHYQTIGVHPAVCSFVSYQPQVLLDAQEDLKTDGESPFSCSRALCTASNLVKSLTNKVAKSKGKLNFTQMVQSRLYTFQSILGVQYGSELVDHIVTQLPAMPEITANPMGAPLPTDLQSVFRVGAHIAANAHDINQAPQLIKYMQRMQPEMARSILTDMVLTGKQIIVAPAMQQFARTLITK